MFAIVKRLARSSHADEGLHPVAAQYAVGQRRYRLGLIAVGSYDE
jgi:hypothetical protein